MKHIPVNKILIMVGGSIFLMSIMFLIISYPEEGAYIKKESVRYKIIPQTQKTKPENEKASAISIIPNENRIAEYKLSFTDFPSKDLADFEKWAVFYLRSHFRHQVVERIDFAFLLPFQDDLKKRFPDSWKEKRSEIIEKAFPENAAMIENLYEKLSNYDDWFKRNRNLMATMNQDEIKEMLWQRRWEIFGESAEKIWDIDSKVLHFKDVVSVFQDASHISLEEKLKVFRSIWDEMRAEEGNDLSAELYKYHLAFIDMESVQSELRQLGAAKRHERMTLIRETMGYDQSQIEERALLDVHEDEEWNKGQQYMRQREEIVSKYTGAECEYRLHSLRKHYFKGEANRIAAEEAANFFRFKQKRIFGRN